jgi:HK97 family phage portal protein
MTVGLLDWLPWRRASEQRSLTAAQFQTLGMLEPPTTAGVTVSERSALTIPAFWSGVNLIANAVAKLPRKVYKSNSDGSKTESSDHTVSWIVADEPNEMTTPFVFWRTLMAHVLTWGNGYAEIEWDQASRPVALWLIPPDRIEPIVEKGQLLYRLSSANVRNPVLQKDDVFHIPGLGFDGVRGYSLVSMMKQTLGLGIAQERYSAAFFGNGAVPGVVLEHPAKLSADALTRLRQSWNAMHQGPDRAHRLAILEENMKAHVITVSARDAQLLESRGLTVIDIARILNIKPEMLGHETGMRPGGNYEAGRMDFLDNALDPWLVAIEQECNRKLFSTAQRGTYFVEHVRNAILRTDAKTRAEVQQLYVTMGAMSPEYVARLENLPKPEPKPEPVAPPPPAPAPAAPAAEEPAAAEDPAARSFARRVIVDVLARMVRLEADRARRASAQGPEKFQAWAEEFYPAHEVRLREALEPAARGWCECKGREDWGARLSSVVSRLVSESREVLLTAKASALEADVEARVSKWERDRPGEAANWILEAL